LHEHFLHVEWRRGSGGACREEARHQVEREHSRRAHLLEAGGGVPCRLHRGADDDGGPRVPRVAHPREVGQDSRRSRVTPMGTHDDKLNLTVFESLKLDKPWTLQTYRSIGGYEVWEKILREKPTRESIIDSVKASGLRGRG